MTYNPSLDPNNPERCQQEANEAVWDHFNPEWRENSIDPEQRRYVDANDVADASEAVVRVPDWQFVPGQDD
jgi:hypothetical protein